MKKLFFAVFVGVFALGLCSDLSAGHYRKYSKMDMGDCPIPCCEKQEVITVRKPAELVCGYVCPDDTVEVDWE